MTLKTHLWKKLLQYEFDTSKIHGQGYHGASNMRGKWNGLQAIVIKKCPYAYYVYCFAHRLQIALVAASREVIPVYHFFNKLSCVINVICALSKRHEELQKSKALEIDHLLELGEIKVGKGAYQVGTLKQAGDTCWRYHYYSVCSLLKMFSATRVVLEGTSDKAFLTMKICKSRLCNKMSDYFLASNLVVYIEREIAEMFDSKYIIDNFKNL